MKRLSFITCIITCISICVFASHPVAADNTPPFYDYDYPQWFDEAKLGIMIHYGLYSVPAYSGKEQYAEWFLRGLLAGDSARIDFQKRTFGDDFDYYDYMHLFKAELFDANQWAELFKQSGAKYIIFTTKHHDGFCLYPSALTSLTTANTPANRDIVGEITTATRKKGLRVGLYFSLTEWTNPLHRWSFDTTSIDHYATAHMIPQFKEIVDLYHPSLIFADGDWDYNYRQLHSDEMVQYFYDAVGKDEAIVNNRWGQGFAYGYKTPEYSSGINEKTPWSECRSLSRSFGLNRNSPLEDYLTTDELIKHFVQLVSLGGGLMLNVSPSADGQIPLLQQERLVQLGRWLSINGEAIYGAKRHDTTCVSIECTSKIKSSTIDFDWVRNSPLKSVSEDNFSIEWHGEITPQKSSTYYIALNADDYAHITISENGKVILDDSASVNSPLLKRIKLQKDKVYDVAVSYKEIDIDASCSLLWGNDTASLSPIQAISAWEGEVRWNEQNIYFTRNNDNLYAICVKKLGKTLSIPIAVAPDAHMRISLLGNDDTPLAWQYIDNNIVIDLSNLSPADIESEHAWTFRFENYFAK